MGTDPVIIGERINPTGKSKFKQALRDHNLEYILREGDHPAGKWRCMCLTSTWDCRRSMKSAMMRRGRTGIAER